MATLYAWPEQQRRQYHNNVSRCGMKKKYHPMTDAEKRALWPKLKELLMVRGLSYEDAAEKLKLPIAQAMEMLNWAYHHEIVLLKFGSFCLNPEGNEDFITRTSVCHCGKTFATTPGQGVRTCSEACRRALIREQVRKSQAGRVGR